VNLDRDVSSIPGRLDGKTCLITGANSGLGKAMSVEFARRGAKIIMGCRREYFQDMEEIKQRSGNPSVELRLLDLSSMDLIDRFCGELADDGVRLDIVMCNAGMVSSRNKLSQDGFPLLLQVNFLGYARMLTDLIKSGVISKKKNTEGMPRIIFTSSTKHKGQKSIDFDHFGALPEYRVRDILGVYGLSKLYMMTFAWELARRSFVDGKPELSVFAFCPGPFRSKIGKSLSFPGSLVMPIMPTGPEKAVWPAVYLACSPDLEGKTMVYYHKRRKEEPDPRVADRLIGEKVWRKTHEMLDRL
jgi:NAD(P)-dependent dehydrogenase (short-subunit alcohol dehydrogenase family)